MNMTSMGLMSQLDALYLDDEMVKAEGQDFWTRSEVVVGEDEIEANMPTIRNSDWHPRLEETYIRSYKLLNLFQISLASLILLSIASISLRQKVTLEGFRRHMEAAKCSIWRTSDSTRAGPVELDRRLLFDEPIEIFSNLMTYFDMLAQIIPALTITLVLANYVT